MTAPLSIIFIVEPPHYQYMACYLVASIRRYLKSPVELLGYCPSDKIGKIEPAVVETLRRMRVEIRAFDASGRFDPAYPHGNKILACLEPRDSAFSAFMDSDILLVKDNDFSGLYAPGHISASVAASMRWAPADLWQKVYGTLGMPLPQERVHLMRTPRRKVLPYFSSGFVCFPETEACAGGKTFAQIWMETAKIIDEIPDLEHKRPYLDQISLPVAMYRAGLKWRQIPENQHFIMGGILRGQPLPSDQDVRVVHYRKWDVLKEAGISEVGYAALYSQVGARGVKWVPNKPLPKGISPL